MQISFFEEFPTKKSLDKLKLINWPTKLYLAAKSLEEFERLKLSLIKNYNSDKKNKSNKINKNRSINNNLKEVIYWPILSKKEGYWISPFSQRKALKRIFAELKGSRVSAMLDLELPTTKNTWLYLTQAFNFLRNKALIKRFIEEHKGQVYLAEYYPEGIIKEKLMEFVGIHYRRSKVKIIKMLYHSLHNYNESFIVKELQRGKKEFGNNFLVAYGTIARGVDGSEPILSVKQLEKDLKIARNMDVKEAVIFRLGGLNKEYLSKIEVSNKPLENNNNY
ncbi:hypothetical protein HYU21_01490 [Candidatus Woesearchaeota archaeon]|nr:hypothetical protein [Candidatus Woesearchaeota archaeon]